MDYNTQRGKLIISEYGRHIQKMIEYASTIEDDEKRQKVAEAIIELMAHFNPSYRNIDEFNHKLWDHLFIISGFKLNVKSPYPIPEPDKFKIKPSKLPYPQGKVKHRHYGKYVEKLIEKAVAMDDPEKQHAFAEVIGNYMKLVYYNWNRENVTDEMIIEDLKRLSGGVLNLTEDSNLDTLKKHRKTASAKKRTSSKSHARKTGNYRNRNRNTSRRRKR